MTEQHKYLYDGSSASGRDTYYKCAICEATQTVSEPYQLDKNQRSGCEGTTKTQVESSINQSDI